ncbi:MAG: aspartyl-tRNA(Asn)/glutamyl-tRNA(Gln) amidotransferase subunit B, partial [Francisellaceae bacterium]
MQWETIIGLEVHAQLNTETKIFSGAPTKFGSEQNTQACLIDMALPGVLPVLNKKVIQKAIKFGLAIDAEISKDSVFDRKNYFYPDLPKGYQTSQFGNPIVGKGHINIQLGDNETKRIRITRAHLEEDAGKSVHDLYDNQTGIDLNRAGTPLLEIVSEPDLRNSQEVIAYLKTLHTLVRYIDISDANMQEGSFRCDVNISLRPFGQKEYGTRAELKNLNSFKFIEKAIEYEVERQVNILEAGKNVIQETRLYDSDKNETRSMRSKEDAHDYRYFPDPDLLPIIISKEDIDQIRKTLPELPQARMERFKIYYKLSETDARILTQDKALADYFEIVVKESHEPKLSANWVIVELLGALNKNHQELKDCLIIPEELGKLISRISDNTISGKIAKVIFSDLLSSISTVDKIIEEKALKQISNSSELETMFDEIVKQKQKQFEDLKNGKTKLMGFFVGKIMQKTQGKANPKQVNEIINKK